MKYFEDFEVGESYETTGRTIRESDVSSYIQLCGLYEEAFVNDEFIERETIFGEPFVPGEMTLSFALGNVVRSGFLEADATLLGVDVDFTEAVFPGDTIYVETTVASKREREGEERGIVVFQDVVRNQDGEEVAEMEKTTLMKKQL